MRVTVRLFGVFRIDRFKESVLELPPGSSVSTVIEQLRIPTPLLGTVLVQGVHARPEDPLTEGDVVTLLPILGGG